MNGNKNKNKIFASIAAVIIAGVAFGYASTIPSEIDFHAQTASPVIEQNKSLSVLVVGDIMLDRNVRNKINKIGFVSFFNGVKDLISEPDIAVANLEGPFTNYPSKTASLIDKQLTFTFDPALAPELANLGFDVLGLANNHTLNFGREGLASTKKYISETTMLYYGDPNNSNELSAVVEKNEIKVGFVGFHEFGPLNFDKILAEIDRLRSEVDILIVSPHWGVEYQKEPTKNMQKWAHDFIDHGADTVIGAHPHIVGDIEEYKGKKIFYSLGNFVFDQYFSEETMNGLALRIDIEKSEVDIGMRFTQIPIRVEREGVFVATSTEP